MASHISKEIKCPFYHDDFSHVIHCEGIDDGTTTHIAFVSKSACSAYKIDICSKMWRECRIARMLDEMYDDNGEKK